jgi:hypothetical protein
MIPMVDGRGAERAGWPDKSPLNAAIQRLQDENPGYRFWLSRDQRLVVATLLDHAVGVDRTLVEDDVESMRKQLATQREQVGRRYTPILAGPAF